MHPRIAVAQGRTRLGWYVVFALPPAGSSRCTTRTLCHRFERLHTGQRRFVVESLDGSVNHTRIDFVYLFPRETEFGYGSRMEVFYKDIGRFQKACQDFLAFRSLHIEFDGALVTIQLQVIQAVHTRVVQQLGSRRVAQSLSFNFNHIGSQPSQHLCTRRSRLNLCPVNHSYTFQRCFHNLFLLFLMSLGG